MNSPGPNRIRFDDFEADLHTEELFRAGSRIRLPRQSFRVLSTLLCRPGQLVAREELRILLWRGNTSVESDQGLNAAVNRLREALGDSVEAPRYIETLPKRGYRFVASLQTSEGSAADPASTSGPLSPAAPPAVSSAPGQPRRAWLTVAAAVSALLLLMASLLWALTRGATHRAATTFREVTPFTSLPGQAIAPTFSPDGSQIAFAWNGGEAAGHQFDLYVKSLGSERLLRLTHHPARWISPAWSPDGTVIAFLRDDSDTPGIYLIPALGGSERRLLTTRVAPGEFRQLSWSPDGKSLLYSGYQFSAEAQLFTLSLDSLSARPLLEPAPRCLDAAEPAFSANGQQLAFICITSSAVYSIDLVDLAHGRTHSLASILGYPQGLAWLADGRLVFSYDPGDGGELWQLSLNGQLTRFPFGEEASAPATDARAGRIAYVRGRNTVNIWRADLAAKDPQDSAVRLIYSTRSQFVPQYSPDGTHIVFQSNRSGSTEIWLADAQGADPERLTSFNGPVTDAPTWCSDGRRIAFDSRASGTSAIYIEDVHQKLPQKVSTSHENLMYPVFSQDCRWLFAKDGNNTLYRFPSSGGPAERVTEHFSPYATVLGDRLIFGVGKPNGVDLWSKPVKGGPESPLVNMPQLRYDDSWTATSSGIFYTDAGSYPVTLNFHDFSTGTNRTVMSLKRIPVPGSGPAMAASPDGRWLLYSQTDAEQSEIMLARDD